MFVGVAVVIVVEEDVVVVDPRNLHLRFAKNLGRIFQAGIFPANFVRRKFSKSQEILSNMR